MPLIPIYILSSSIIAQKLNFDVVLYVSMEDTYGDIIIKALEFVPFEFVTGNEWLISPMNFEIRTVEQKKEIVDLSKLTEGKVYLWLAMKQ